MMPVGPFLAHLMSVSTGPIMAVSSSWQIFTNACSGVISLTPYSLERALRRTCSPSAFSLTRSRNPLVTLNSTSASSRLIRTSRRASSMFSSVSSATPDRRCFAARNPRDKVSNMAEFYNMQVGDRL